jgi:hypothetical protein
MTKEYNIHQAFCQAYLTTKIALKSGLFKLFLEKNALKRKSL